MDGWTIGADVATMLTGASAVTATYVWTRNQLREFRERRKANELRTWHGFIMADTIDTWAVRLADDPKTPTALVTLEVLSGVGGEPDDVMAYNLRQRILIDGMLSRPPTQGEQDLLVSLVKERRYQPGGFPCANQSGRLRLRWLLHGPGAPHPRPRASTHPGRARDGRTCRASSWPTRAAARPGRS